MLVLSNLLQLLRPQQQTAGDSKRDRLIRAAQAAQQRKHRKQKPGSYLANLRWHRNDWSQSILRQMPLFGLFMPAPKKTAREERSLRAAQRAISIACERCGLPTPYAKRGRSKRFCSTRCQRDAARAHENP